MKTRLARFIGDVELGAHGGTTALLFILLLAGVRSALLAVSRPFWLDEITTVLMCRMPSQATIWEALAQGADSNPPVFHFVERLSRAVIGHDPLGYRFPSILGFLIAIACIYFFLSKRVSSLAALAGASVVLCTALAGYVADARPYALMVGCVALAILAWQRIDDTKLYALATAAALAAAISLHYYAILVWPSFFMAEMSVWLLKRRFRASAWAAIVVGAFPLLFFARLLLHFRELYGPHFWTLPSVSLAFFAHDSLFNLSSHWGWTVAVGLTVMVLFLRSGSDLRACLRGQRIVDPTGVPAEEAVMTLMLLWLPIVAVAAAKLGHGGMTEQYMLPAVLGGAFAVGYAINEAPSAARALLVLLLLVQYASSSGSLVRSVLNGSLLTQRENSIREVATLTRQASEANLPVVVTNDAYMPMYYYASAESRRWLYTIADAQAPLTFSSGGANSLDLTLLALRQYSPIQVEDYASFLSAHHQFLMMKSEDGEEWLTARLLHDGDSLELVSWPPHGDPIFKVTVHP